MAQVGVKNGQILTLLFFKTCKFDTIPPPPPPHTHTLDTGRVPGAVLFRAEPDTNTSIFVEWNVPSDPNTHPLLLRYQVFLVSSPFRREESFGPFPAYQRNSVVTGLEPGMEYAVSVVASSLDGQGELPAVNVTVATFGMSTCV